MSAKSVCFDEGREVCVRPAPFFVYVRLNCTCVGIRKGRLSGAFRAENAWTRARSALLSAYPQSPASTRIAHEDTSDISVAASTLLIRMIYRVVHHQHWISSTADHALNGRSHEDVAE